MKVGVLETGKPPQALQPVFGSYPAMFRSLLGDDWDWRTYDLEAGAWPGTPDAADAWIVTGSSAGVYDPEPWIAPLMEFLRRARGRARLVGVCFGHQALAQAFGGTVVRSPKGWGVGLHRYRVAAPDTAFMDDAREIAVAASHQDQVVEPPPGSRVLACSTFTPFGMLEYAGGDAISIQLHPEFDPDYAKALIESRRGTRFTDDQADAAIAGLDAPNDRATVGGWIRRFIEAR